MARKLTLTFDTGRVLSETWATTTGPSWLAGSGDGTSQTRTRGGRYSFYYNASAQQARFPGGGAGDSTDDFGRLCINLQAVPGAAGPWNFKGSEPVMRITNTRTVEWLIGSVRYTTPVLDLNRWYVFEWYKNLAAAGNDSATFWVDGVQVYTSSGSELGGTVSSNFDFGTNTTVAGLQYFLADICSNNSTGALQNGRPGMGKSRVLLPMADSAVGANWLRGDATSGSMFQALDGVPVAGAAAGTSSNRVQNSVATASSLDVSCESYAEAGIPESAQIVMTQGTARVAVSSLTGTNTGTIQLVSNPADAGTTAIDYEGSLAVIGTDPTGWRTYRTTPTYNPTVTRSTRPVMRLNRTTDGSTRGHYADQLGVVVEWIESLGFPHAPTNRGQRRYLRNG